METANRNRSWRSAAQGLCAALIAVTVAAGCSVKKIALNQPGDALPARGSSLVGGDPIGGSARLADPMRRTDPGGAPAFTATENYRAAEARLLAAVQQSNGGALECNELAALYQLLGKYSQSEIFYRRALRAWEAAHPGEKPGLERILNNLATLYLNAGKIEKAEKICWRAATLSEQDPNLPIPDRARLLGSLGQICHARRRFHEAEAYFR